MRKLLKATAPLLLALAVPVTASAADAGGPKMKFVSYCQFVTDKEKIAEYGPQHHHYIQDLRKMGKVVAAGPFADKTGALFVFDVIDRSDLEAIIADDPFTKAGVFAHCEIKELAFV